MNPEIENLINMALADGEITEKERAIILRKAESIGEDIDAVEIMINRMMYDIKLSQKKYTKEKVGNIRICPSCGASFKSFSSVCEYCGIEFSNTTISTILQKLEKELNEIDKRKIIIPKTNIFESDIQLENRKNREKANIKKELILNFKIPYEKEAVLSFLFFAVANFSSVDFNIDDTNESIIAKAYRAKALELLNVSKVMFKTDSNFLHQVYEIEKKLGASEKTEKQRKKIFWFIVLIPILASIVFFIFIFNGTDAEKQEVIQYQKERNMIIDNLYKIEQNINLYIEKNDFEKARFYAKQLVWTWELQRYENEKLETEYNQKRERYLESIKELEKK